MTIKKMTPKTPKEVWGKLVVDALVGRKIVKARYLTDDEVTDLGWQGASIALFLDDGNIIYPSTDDEGNGPGALFTTIPDLETIPVI